MAVFAYKAIDARYSTVRGTIAADTPRQARDLLRAQGLTVEQVEGQQAGVGGAVGRRGWSIGRGRTAGKVNAMVRQLATLLSVGAPLLEALDTVSRQHRGSFQRTLLLLRERVAAGTSLHEAMAEQPGVFDELCVNLTTVGEDAGTLDITLLRLAQFRERARQLKGKVATSLIYPCIVLVTAIAVSIFLMTYVVPSILAPLLEQGKPLPLPTRLVKGTSDLLLEKGWLIALAALAVTVGVVLPLRTPGGRLFWHRLVLRLPVFGDLVRKAAIVKVAVVMSTLLKGGVVFVRALEIAARSTSNLIVRRALLDCAAAVNAGGEIAPALERTSAFPPLVVHLFALGQQSGRLDEMLDELANQYDSEVAVAGQRLSAVLEPALMVIMAGLVLCIVLAVMLPILEAGNVLQ